MPSRREIPIDPLTQNGAFTGQRHTRRPMTEMQALMEAAPGCEVQASVEEGLELRDVITDAIDSVLTPRERFVFDALVVERQSVRQLGRQMSISKTHITRIRDAAIRKLAAHLRDDPTIKEHLT